MRKKLLFKFIAIYVLIALTAFILLSTVVSSLIRKLVISYESRNLYREASSIAEDDSLLAYRNAGAETTDTKMRELYTTLSKLAVYQGCQFQLISARGDVYLDTAEPFDPDTPYRLEGFDPLALGSDYYTVGNFFGYFSDEHLSVMVPIAANMNIRGYVAVHTSMKSILEFREQILGVVHLICIVLFLIFLSVFVLLYITVLRPLRKITEGTRHFAAGDLKYNIPVHARDEMGQLASSLNYMSDELAKSGEYQKKFIANVSHDFRSPLTSIKGFVEAILDGTIPPEMQEKYLRIVLGETERLTKLTNGILTLNTMDQKKNLLEITEFDINEVIRSTAETFEGICRPRQISLKLALTGEELMVRADKEKIQQVIYNLVDNAIKFSKDNSSVEIDSDLRHDKVFVSVKDHGIGIPSGSLNKIWERFYKTDASRGRERKGNGLGLSIVREIIKEHGQNITVISTEGVGTEFVFSLDPGAQ